MENQQFKTGSNQVMELVADLRRRHQTMTSSAGSFMTLLFTRPQSLRQLGALFTTPLETMRSEIPLDDVSTDLEVFGIVSTLAQHGNRELPVMRLGPEKKPVPVLPAYELPQSVFNENRPSYSTSRAKSLFGKVMQDALHDDRIEMKSISEAREGFFNGLQSFLLKRITGVRWARNQTSAEREKLGITKGPPEGGGPPVGGGGGAGGNSDDYQAWMVHTDQDGLSLGYGGTHAVRIKPKYLGAETTPLRVYLPMGTLFLAANAGPGGRYIWDEDVEIEVPSLDPTYKTKKF